MPFPEDPTSHHKESDPLPAEPTADGTGFVKGRSTAFLDQHPSALGNAEAQQQINDVLERITDAFLAFDRDWRATYINQEAARLLRLDRATLLSKEIWQEIFQCTSSTTFEQELRRAAREQNTVEFESFASNLGVWLEVRAYPSPQGLSVYFRDITLAKQNEALRSQNDARLQESQRLLQQINDTIPGILYIYDLIEQRNVYVNQQIFNILGYTADQIQAMGALLLPKIIHPEDLALFPKHIAQFHTAKNGEILENEYRMRHASGEWRWFSGRELVFSRTPEGKPKQILGTAFDITERKQVEAALRSEKERFELAAAAVDCLIYDWNISTQRVERTEGLTRIFGYLPEEIEPTSDWWIARVHPDDLAACYESLQRSLAIGDRYANEYRVRTKDDRYIYVLDQGLLVRNEQGEPTRIVGSTSDISERKFNEQRQQLLLELNDAIRAVDEPEKVIEIVTTLVGQRFKVTCCSYAEIDQNEALLTTIYNDCNDAENPTGQHPLTSLGTELLTELLADLRQGKPVAISDLKTDNRTSSHHKQELAPIAAFLAVPLINQGKFVAVFVLSHTQPRPWMAEEIALIEEVANRIWLAIDRVKTERELRYSEERFQRLAHNVPGVISRYIRHADGTGRIRYISPSCRNLFERDPEAIQQNDAALWNLIHPDDRQSWRDALTHSAETGESIHWEGRYVLPSGQVKWVQIASRPEKLSDGSILWDGIATDITLHKETVAEREHLLAQSQQYANQLRGLTEAALAINSALSIEEVVQVITEQARAIIGSHQGLTTLVFDQDWQKAIHTMSLSDKYANWRNRSAKPDGSGIYTMMLQISHPIRLTQAELEAHPRWHGYGKEAGKHLPLRGWLAAPLIWRDGQNFGLIQLSDKYEGEFTEADEDILVQLTQMASVAIENTRLYEAEQNARTEAEAANRIKDEFLAVLSHELRSPLNPILGWSKLLRSRKLDEEATDRALEIIERNAKLQTQLIEDLLDVSRILRGKLSLKVAPVDLQGVTGAAIETVRLAAEAKSIQIRTRFDSPTTVMGDPNRLQQIVWNLLSNAVKFTDVNGQIEVKLECVNHQAQIRVTDNGKGIEPDFLPYIFDYFRQEDSATTRKFGGLGLGLAIVRHLVELHGGTVHAASPGEGKGATFVVRLPLVKGTNSAINPDASADNDAFTHSQLKDVRVLIVDDETDSQEIVAYTLEQSGAITTAVGSAKAAIQAIIRSEFDLLISDIGMPEMDGYMLMRQIKSLSLRNGSLKAIALTAYAAEEDQQKALEAGFLRHVSKPIDPAELLKVVVETMQA